MTDFFTQTDINEFRECFYFYAKEKYVNSKENLTLIMRSLGFSPTDEELENYFHEKGEKIDFAEFLQIMQKHSEAEKCEQDIMAAFAAHNGGGKSTVPVNELVHILSTVGEKLSKAEIEQMLKSVGAQRGGTVRGEDVLRVLLTPQPDY